MSSANDYAEDAYEKQSQNPQRTSQSEKNTNPSYPISTRRPAKHELPQSTSVANQSDLFTSEPKKGKYTKEEDMHDENEGTVNGFSVSTSAENVCSNISDRSVHTNDSNMKIGQMGTIIAQDNMPPNRNAIIKPILTDITVTNDSMTKNDKVCNMTTLPLQESDVADSKEPYAIIASCNNKAAKHERVTSECLSHADASDVSYSARSPNYTEENACRATYRKWPSAANHNIESMVDAGFFYTGDEDIVRCFCCDIGLTKWDNADDPWEEHARHSPDCQYLKYRKSEEFISNIQMIRSKIYSPRHPQYSDMMTRYETFDSSWPGELVSQSPEQLAAAGFFYTGVLEVNNPSATLKNILNDDGDKVDMDSKHTPGPVIKNPHNSTDETSSGDRDKKIDSDPIFNTLRQENERLKEQIKCKICLDEDIWFVFIPCGHIIACFQCGNRALKCKDCDLIIQERRKIKLV